MTEITIQNIDSITLQKLEALAKQHGRSLQEEIKHILESTAQAQASLEESEIIYQKAVQMQKQLESHGNNRIHSEIENVSESLNIATTMEQLRTLKQTIASLQGLSIREAIEEGRRF